MALPILPALAKIASSIVAGTAKGLATAAKATAKGAATTAKVAGKAAGATGKGLVKGTQATVKGFGKVTSSSGKGLRKVGKSMSNIGKGKSKSTKITHIRKTAKKIKKSIIEYNKKSKKLRLNKERMRRNMLERQKQRSKEKKLESKKGSFQNALKSVTGAPMSFMDKLLGFGGLLLTGILVNSLDKIIKKFKDFKANNQGLFTAVGNVAKFIKNTFTYLFDEMTKPFGEEGSLDWLAKFKDDGTLESGILKDLKDLILSLKPFVDILLPFKTLTPEQVKSKTENSLEEYGYSKDKYDLVPQPDGTFKIIKKDATDSSSDAISVNGAEGSRWLPVKAKPRLGRWTADGWEKTIGVEIYPEGNLLDRYTNKGQISPITPKDKNLGDQSSLGFGDSTTIIIATQPVMQPFPISYAVPVKSKSKVNNSMVAFNNPLWTGVA